MSLQMVTVWFLIITPLLILLLDTVVFYYDPYATITYVVRRSNAGTGHLEVIYVMVAVLGWFHLFRNWM